MLTYQDWLELAARLSVAEGVAILMALMAFRSRPAQEFRFAVEIDPQEK